MCQVVAVLSSFSPPLPLPLRPPGHPAPLPCMTCPPPRVCLVGCQHARKHMNNDALRRERRRAASALPRGPRLDRGYRAGSRTSPHLPAFSWRPGDYGNVCAGCALRWCWQPVPHRSSLWRARLVCRGGRYSAYGWVRPQGSISLLVRSGGKARIVVARALLNPPPTHPLPSRLSRLLKSSHQIHTHTHKRRRPPTHSRKTKHVGLYPAPAQRERETQL